MVSVGGSGGRAVSDESVWTIEPGERRQPGIVHVVMMALFIGIGIVVGTLGSLAIPIGFVSAFWPGQAVQAVGGLWFGLWGVVAGMFFPFISNALSGSAPIPVSAAYLPANFLQSFLAAASFRWFKADPRLRTGRDWVIWVVFGVLLANFLGAFWGTYVLKWFGLITGAARITALFGWFIGNTIPSLIFGSILLKYVSPMVLRSKAFAKGWLA
jgi:integral membrane sensor domain MASE1